MSATWRVTFAEGGRLADAVTAIGDESAMYVDDDAGQSVLLNIRGLLDASESFLDAATDAGINNPERDALSAAVTALDDQLATFANSDIELGANATAIEAATAHLLQVQNALTYSQNGIARTLRLLTSTTSLLKVLQSRDAGAVATALAAIKLPWPIGPA